MRRIALIILLEVIIGFLCCPAMESCPEGVNIQFADLFFFPDLTWTFGSDQYGSALVRNKRLEISAAKGCWHYVLNSNLFNEMCFESEVTPLQMSEPNCNAGSVMFWAKSAEDCYQVMLARPDYYAVMHTVGSKDFPVIDWKEDPVIKAAVGQTTKVRVYAPGNEATVFINGKQLGHFTGAPPAEGWKIGFAATAGDKDSESIAFDNVVVTDVMGANMLDLKKH